ncbi:MAG: hypothetical protein R3C05_19470 [Pirellulaceae bacterium]
MRYAIAEGTVVREGDILAIFENRELEREVAALQTRADTIRERLARARSLQRSCRGR